VRKNRAEKRREARYTCAVPLTRMVFYRRGNIRFRVCVVDAPLRYLLFHAWTV
jgi:hypothetical protein